MIARLSRRTVRATLSIALAGLFAVSACGEKDGAGPPKTNCPPGFCAQAPICGEACSSACGCCPCTDGVEKDFEFFTYICSGGCFVPKIGGTGGVGGGAGSGGSAGSAGGTQDGGTDCAALGCAAPVVCGQSCPVECPPPQCVDGEGTQIGGAPYVCSGGCFQPV